jgi:ectoine hydroxylase-related dioxygenase (phytanoyl-CoA dioxygenase family)
VEPPQALLEQMFTLRLHLDDCGPDNGPLKVVPGSHKLGRVSALDLLRLGSSAEPLICLARAGDIVAMKALAVHASSPADAPSHRRVLHLDFTTASLPSPLEWATD